MQKYKLQDINMIGGGDKTCSKFPSLPSVVNTDRTQITRIIAIGDIHGDLDLAINCLIVANLIKRVYEKDDSGLIVDLQYKDEKIKRMYKWIGEKTIAVQVGDQVDRCRPFEHECHVPEATVDDEASDVTIMFFYHELHVVALTVGCALYSLLGNHELLNVLGNMRYVSYKGLKEFPTKANNIAKGRINAFKIDSKNKIHNNESSMAEFLACSRLTSIIVDKYLFIHAGIMDKLIKYMEKKKGDNVVLTINNLIKEWLLDNNGVDDKILITKLLSVNFLSPFWPRVFGTLKKNLDKESDECVKYVRPVLELLNLKGIIVGHTPQLKHNINSTCSSTVWRVDVAGSQAFDQILFEDGKTDEEKEKIQKGRVPQVLEITLGKDEKDDSFKLLPDELNH